MTADGFFSKRVPPGESYLGIILIDIAHHSSMSKRERNRIPPRLELEDLIRSTLASEDVGFLPSHGDAICIVFPIEGGCDGMVLFANLIQTLVHHLNQTHLPHNTMPESYDAAAQIVCHAGAVAHAGTADSMSGEAINSAFKYNREIGIANAVVMTQEVYMRLSPHMRLRCTPSRFGDHLGQSFVLDGLESTPKVSSSFVPSGTLPPKLGRDVFVERDQDEEAKQPMMLDRLESTSKVSSPAVPSVTLPPELGHDVFLVHGQDEEAKQSVARVIEKLGLTPIILHEQANQGRTVIEKFEGYADVGFTVVLLTPDDVGGTKTSPDKLTDRARQNVVFELGFFFGKLGRQRVCALLKGEVEFPSDISGILWVRMDSPGAWRFALAKEMRGAGLDIDMNKLV